MTSTQYQQKTIKKSYPLNQINYLDFKSQRNIQKQNFPLKKLFKGQDSNSVGNQRKRTIDTSQVLQQNDLKSNSQSFILKKSMVNPLKIEHNQNQCFDKLNQSNIRLFTFMQSTQKQNQGEPNKQNEFSINLIKKKSNHYDKLILNQYLKKSQRKLENSQNKKNKKYVSKQTNQSVKHSKRQQIQLLSFIQNSRKKREQLLIQLENIDFVNINQLCTDKFNCLTPSHQSIDSQVQQIKRRVQSTRNFNKKENYFSSTNLNQPNTIRQNCKNLRPTIRQQLRQRHLSAISLNEQKRKRSFDKLSQFNTKNQKIKDKQQKNPSIFNKLSNSPINLKIIKANDFERLINFKINTSHQSIPRQKSTVSIKNTLNNFQSSKHDQKQTYKSISRTSKSKSVITKRTDQANNVKDIEKNLMKRKKQLENQLLNINDQMILFNRKKKKDKRTFK